MAAEYLGLSAVGWHVMIKNWWDKLLAAFLLTTIVLGFGFILFRVFAKIRKHWNGRNQFSVIPSAVARYLETLEKDGKAKLPLQQTFGNKYESFGVFLGAFANPPTSDQTLVLSKWDVLVLDPLQDGVWDAASSENDSKYILGRLDLKNLLNSDSSSSNDEVIRSLGVISQTITTYLKSQDGRETPFDGVVLVHWQTHFRPAVLNKLVQYINSLGFEVWLEMSPPVFLTESESREIYMEQIRGIICRNGTIMSDGQRRDYFQMAEMRSTLRLVAGQRVIHGPTLAMWEVVDDDVELDQAVVRRSFTWCQYYSALCWVGPAAASMTAEIATTKIIDNEPLGALTWLKSDEVSTAHDIWRKNDKISSTSSGNNDLYNSLQSFVPDLATKLSLIPPPDKEAKFEDSATVVEGLEWPLLTDHTEINPFSTSPDGHEYTGFGCFQLGLDCTSKDNADLVNAQARLRELNLLDRINSTELRQIGQQLQLLCDSPSIDDLDGSQTIKLLLDSLKTCNGDDNDRLRVYIGLHSGFRTTSETQFWGLYEVEPVVGVMNVYISGKTNDRAGTILHTFLSSRGYNRTQCFMAEMALSRQTNGLIEPWKLSGRIVDDVEQLTPTEAILFVQRLEFSNCENCSDFATKIKACCEYQLIEVPSLIQQRALNAEAYLRGEVSAEDLVMSRLAWIREQGCWHPEPLAAISLFKEIDVHLPQVLIKRQNDLLIQLKTVIQTCLQKHQIDAGLDILALSVFCAFRKLAFNEIYIEVLDRNPMPNAHTVQPACFAENYALGSRCDLFLDITPKVLGEILSDRFREYYKQYQPPPREEAFTELPTAYASMQIDLDPQGGEEEVPLYYRVTFLGIFAVPALIDITLLTTVGRGLYLTTFMSSTIKTMATTALMLALLVCGSFGSWLTSGGSYYFYAMAFPAMNMFVVTRFIAGLTVALVGALAGLIGISIVKGFTAGIIFFYYFLMLSTYLLTLSALSIYQLPGFHFQSGRTVIIRCVPILFISPVVSLFVQHDILVYLCVLTVFLISLLIGARRIISQWSTWYLNIPCATDAEIVNWFLETRASNQSELAPSEDIEAVSETPIPRKALWEKVNKERTRPFWKRSTSDPFVSRLADGYEATRFLMVWYCKFNRTKMPYPYSPTWNLQLRAAVDTMGDMQKGLKLHNSFLHWRQTGSDVWSGMLYFIVALMDKWVALVTSGGLVGLSVSASSIYRLSVGFGLCYYLIGAVSLDAVSQPLWILANKTTPQSITSLEFLQQATINDYKARKSLYWKSLVKFFFLHIWGLSITSALLWTFEASRDAAIMYLAYVGAYTGLLWYQYNKIFTGPLATKSLATASIIGFIAGIILHVRLPNYAYSSIISLAIATWTAALHSLWMANIGIPKSRYEKHDIANTEANDKLVSHYFTTLGPYPEISQTTLSKKFDVISDLPSDLRYKLDPSTHPGVEVMEILQSQCRSKQPKLVQEAFMSAESLIGQVAGLWKTGEMTIELVPECHILQHDQKIRTISRMTGDKLHVFIAIGLDLAGEEWRLDIHRNCQVIAEAAIQAAAETRLGLSHDHSILTEVLTVNDTDDDELLVPEGVKRQLEISPAERARVIKNGNKVLLRHLLLGLDCDRDWDNLPQTIRTFLLKRCYGSPLHISADQKSWIISTLCTKQSVNLEEYIARCDLGANLTSLINAYAEALETDNPFQDQEVLGSTYERVLEASFPLHISEPRQGFVGSIRMILSKCHQKIRSCIKFTVLSLVADPEYQRELDYMLAGKHLLLRWAVTITLNGIWSLCKTLQRLIIPFALFYGRENVLMLYRNMRRMKTVVEKHRITIEYLSGPSTCFSTVQPDGSSIIHQYRGRHDHEPGGLKQLMAINTFTDKLVLRQREEYSGGKIVNKFTYEYPQDSQNMYSKLPIQRQCIEGDLKGQIVQYDDRGYITSGSIVRGENSIQFKFWYRKNAKFDDELLRAEYVFPHITIKISWSMPPRKHSEKLDKWIPYPQVTEATFIQGSDVHYSKWNYDHKFHPGISTFLNGEQASTPPMIQDDWFHVLEKPKNCSFLADNPLLSFSSVKTSFLSSLFGRNIKYYPMPTSRARTYLWKCWKGGKEFDAITARWLDEYLLRSDRVLNPYWRNRDMGRLDAAEDYLDAQADTILARVDVDPEVSSWTPLAFKISDLYSFGQGGDSRINTRTLSTQMRESDGELHVLAMDTATWPNEPGGVSACRRDLVNDIKTIRWHIMSEAANDYGVPRFQIERNVQSLMVLPQWGLDFLNPAHGMLQSCLDSEIVQKSQNTTATDIERNFIPILAVLVRCSRLRYLNRQNIEEATQALVDLNNYFELSRNWNDVWKSKTVQKAWREFWLTEDSGHSIPLSEWLDAERPTLLQLDQALDMWHRYLFIFSVPVPERIPDVFQASHHFTGATYGVLCKAKRKCTLQVWDHCISFREMTTFLSSAVSFDSTFVNTTLMGLGHLSCVLIEHHADVVLPCAEYFNPQWEVELGTCEGRLQHRRTFARKIDPVVNGITNMEKYEPIKEIKSEVPTVVMLSHIRYVKDIKGAIMAADIIVNKWGFTDYRLHIYGDMERAAAYSTECQELIASKSLRNHVALKGLGNPSVVLQDAWLFLNSSVSEGLPLAMGEAALTGVPVVCTDVGASFCVVTDRSTGKRFSAVVAPNDADSLARAQISVLGLTDEWSAFDEDEEGIQPKLSFQPSPEEVKYITKRMYEKREQRRRLGMLGRQNVLRSFSSQRYLREHEQMLWLGKYRSPSYSIRTTASSSTFSKFQKEKSSDYIQTPPMTPDIWEKGERRSRRA